MSGFDLVYNEETGAWERKPDAYMMLEIATMEDFEELKAAVEFYKRHKWIPVRERLPESENLVLVSAREKTFGYRHTLIAAHIGHHEATTEDSGWREYEGDTEYDEENDCFWIPECWWEVNAVEDNGNWIIDSEYEVTHWMPLPEPQKEE